ncbi:MAG: DNA-processing protein DprA [Oscillospiraceae bacterium]
MAFETRDWLRISLAFGVTNIKKWDYIDIDHPEESLEKLLSNNTLQYDEYVRSIKRVSNSQLDAVIECCERNNISMLTPGDLLYPDSFRELANPPAVVYALGDTEYLSSVPSVAIVGARNCCDYSVEVAHRFSVSLAQRGVNIVSGLARGIDTAAHMGALEVSGRTTAVLGCGLLYDYPKGSMPLKKRITERGAVLTEYPPTAPPAKDNFKIRNRLVTALSDSVLIVEAGERSGTLNTASHAAEQGREVFVIPPHDLFDNNFAGQKGLLRDGASLAMSPNDIFSFLRDLYT